MKTTHKKLLAKYDRLTDLLKMAWEQKEKSANPLFDVYEVQDKLAREYEAGGAPYLWSMPYRHLYACGLCGASSTEMEQRVVNPVYINGKLVLNSASILESEMHNIRFHHAPLPEALKEVLKLIK